MNLILGLALCLQGQSSPPPAQKPVALVLSETEEKADKLILSLGKGDVTEAAASKAGFVRREESYYLVYLDRGLVDDETFDSIRKVVEAWRGNEMPEGFWVDMKETDRKLYRNLFAQGFLGRTPGGLEKWLNVPGRRLAYEVDFEIARPGQKLPIRGSLSREGGGGTPKSPTSGKQTPRETEFAGGRSVAMRMTRGFARKFEPEVVGRAFKLLDEMREQKLETVRAELDREGWKRLQKRLSKPNVWDGKTPIRYGDLDPVLQDMVKGGIWGGTISPDEKVGPIRFNFLIGLAMEGGASVNGLFTAYR